MYFDRRTIKKVLEEIREPQGRFLTMQEWLKETFGPTLNKLFFEPFYESYTAGLYDKIAPQDNYKTPLNLSLVFQGFCGDTPLIGYNTMLDYPQEGYDRLIWSLVKRCDIYLESPVVKIDRKNREIYFQDGQCIRYGSILSSIPLNRMVQICGLKTGVLADPFTAVLVLNMGAIRGSHCPDYHWLYTTGTRSGFYRIGFCSNVDSSFLPRARSKNQ